MLKKKKKEGRKEKKEKERKKERKGKEGRKEASLLFSFLVKRPQEMKCETESKEQSDDALAHNGTPDASQVAGGVNSSHDRARTHRTVARMSDARRECHVNAMYGRGSKRRTLCFNAAVFDDGRPVASGFAGPGGMNGSGSVPSITSPRGSANKSGVVGCMIVSASWAAS